MAHSLTNTVMYGIVWQEIWKEKSDIISMNFYRFMFKPRVDLLKLKTKQE